MLVLISFSEVHHTLSYMFVFKSAEFINTSLITDAIKIGKSIQNLAYPVIGPYVYKTNLPLTSDALDNTQTLI